MLTLLLATALAGAVPQSAVRILDGRAYVSCQWVQEHRADLSCRQTPDSVALSDTFRPRVVWQIDRRGLASDRAASGAVPRQVKPPLREKSQFWLAAGDLKLLLGVPVFWQAGQVWLGATPGSERARAGQTAAQQELADLSRQHGPTPSAGHGEGEEEVALIPAGRADERCDWLNRQVTCWRWQGGAWQRTWQAQTRRTPLDRWPTPAPGALDAVLGETTTVTGRQPVWPGGLHYEALGGSGMGRAVRRGQVAPGGDGTPTYEKAGSIDDAFAPTEF